MGVFEGIRTEWMAFCVQETANIIVKGMTVAGAHLLWNVRKV